MSKKTKQALEYGFMYLGFLAMVTSILVNLFTN